MDGFVTTHNQYEVTPSGLRGTHTTYKYANNLVARRTDEVMELTPDKNWKLLTKSETIFHYTKQKDVSYTETTVLDANNNLVQSILTDYTYSARGKLHSFDQFIYDKNNLLSNEFHYECTPRPICTIQKDYVPVSKNPGQVVLALAVLHDKYL